MSHEPRDSALLIRPDAAVHQDVTIYESATLAQDLEVPLSGHNTLLHFLLGGSLLPHDPLCP